MRPIDADKLLEKVQFRMPVVRLQEKIIADCVEIMRNLIGDAPTLDVVPVVRCKDCELRYGSGCPMANDADAPLNTGDNGFCDRGRRRDDATD